MSQDPATPPPAGGPAPAVPATGHPHHLSNTLLLGTVEVGWGIAMAVFAAEGGVIPLLLRHLGASYAVLAALPALYYATALPFELAAPYLAEALPRKKKTVYLLHLVNPTLWGILGLLLLSDPSPGARSIAFFLVPLGVSYATIGFLAPLWYDFMGKITDPARRGSAFSLIFTAQSIAGFAGAWLSQRLLEGSAELNVRGYGACFLLVALVTQLSNQAFLGTVEAEGTPPPPRPPLASYLRSIVGFLRDDRDLRGYVLARGITRLAPAVTAFYAVQAKAHVAAVQPLRFAATVVLGKLGCSLLAWRFADVRGMKPFLVLGYLALAAASLLAGLLDLAHEARWGTWPWDVVALLVGVYLSADSSANATFVMNLAPEGRRASYLIAVNVTLAPLAAGVPLLAGVLADAVGAAPLQLGASVLFALAALQLVVFVRERRPTGALA